MTQILANLQKNVHSAKQVVVGVAADPPGREERSCSSAPRDAIATPLDIVPGERRRELGPLLDRYFESRAAK